MQLSMIDYKSSTEALSSYAADRIAHGKKSYILLKGNGFVAKTLTFWEKIDLFVQKLFNLETPDNLLGKIRDGFAKLKSLVLQFGINIEKNNLCEKAVEISEKLYDQQQKNLKDQIFATEHGAKVAAIFLTSKGFNLQIAKDGEKFRLIDSYTNLASKYKLELHAANVNVSAIAEHLDNKFFGGERVISGTNIVQTLREDLEAYKAEIQGWEDSSSKEIALEAITQQLQKLDETDLSRASTPKQATNIKKFEKELKEANFHLTEVKLYPKNYSEDAAEKAVADILNARLNLLQSMG